MLFHMVLRHLAAHLDSDRLSDSGCYMLSFLGPLLAAVDDTLSPICLDTSRPAPPTRSAVRSSEIRLSNGPSCVKRRCIEQR
jgi:hypothetical protein